MVGPCSDYQIAVCAYHVKIPGLDMREFCSYRRLIHTIVSDLNELSDNEIEALAKWMCQETFGSGLS